MRRRDGFTLVELLVVVAILAVMAALSIRVIVGFAGIGRDAATRTTVQKIQRAVESRQQAFLRRYGGNDPSTIARLHKTREWIETATYQTANGGTVSDAQRLILTRKLLYQRFCPQSPADLQTPTWGLSAGDVSGLDNAEILYYVLTKSPIVRPDGTTAGGAKLRGPSLYTDAVLDVLAQETSDVDNDGNREFRDGWGQPIRFYRWPAALYHEQIDATGRQSIPHQTYTAPLIPTVTRPADKSQWGTGIDQLARDPDDPLRLMSGVANFAAQFHDPATFWLPLVVSAGPDGDFGLTEAGAISVPWNASISDADNVTRRLDPLTDNISAARIRAGGN